MAEFIALIVDCVLSLIEICISFFVWLGEFVLRRIVGHDKTNKTETDETTAEGVKPARKQLTVRDATIASVTFLVIILMCVGAWAFFSWRAEAQQRLADETMEVIDVELNRLADELKGKSTLPESSELSETLDGWGMPLIASYEQSAIYNTVTLHSSGSDQTAGTDDDLYDSRRVLRPKKEIAKGVVDRVKTTILNRLSTDK